MPHTDKYFRVTILIDSPYTTKIISKQQRMSP